MSTDPRNRRHGILAFETHMHEREACRALFSFGGTLSTLDPADVPNVTEAKRNARAFARETVMMLQAIHDPEELAESKAPEGMVAWWTELIPWASISRPSKTSSRKPSRAQTKSARRMARCRGLGGQWE